MSGWSNWAREQRCDPVAIERPRNRAELIAAVERAATDGREVRAAGSGHSFTDIALTDGVMLRLEALDRVLDADPGSGLIKLEAGIVLGQMNRRLDEHGRALANLGDIDRQTLGGSISTGTHGTGIGFQSVSAQVHAIELVTADGRVVELTDESDPDGIRAARVGLGALGAIYAVTLKTVPAFTIHRDDRARPLRETLDGLEELVAGFDHFEFYVFPQTEVAVCRESRRTDETPQPRPRAAVYMQEVVVENGLGRLLVGLARHVPSLIPRLTALGARTFSDSTKIDSSHRVFASDRRVKFTEMEYSIPVAHAREAVERVLEVAARPEHRVAFPIEVRFVAADDAFLSTSHGRESCYIAVHHDRKLDWRPYFDQVEAIMREYSGRPHWGKRHFRSAAELAPLYERWDDFQAVRARLDPRGVFRNAYTDRVLGPVG
jgi:L-gulonolactone oxidase